MKSSQYNVLTKNSQREKAILFNTLYGSITLWDKSEIGVVRQLLDTPEIEIKDETTKLIMSHLVEEKYIIDDKIDEINIAENNPRSSGHLTGSPVSSESEAAAITWNPTAHQSHPR